MVARLRNRSSLKRKSTAHVPRVVDGYQIGIFKWERSFWPDGTRSYICNDLPNGCSAMIISTDHVGVRGGRMATFSVEIRSEEGEKLDETSGLSLRTCKQVAELTAYRHDPAAVLACPKR